MRRVARHLFTLLSALSLLLCVATCVRWVRSYAARDMFPEELTKPGFSVQSTAGRVFVGHVSAIRAWPAPLNISMEVAGHEFPIWQPPPDRLAYGTRYVSPPARLGNAFGFGTYEDRIVGGRGGWAINVVAVPYWAISFLFAALALPLAFARLRARARRRQGLCPNCGYDLRASPERCPECGTVTPSAAGQN
jgi:hypothetical protein